MALAASKRETHIDIAKGIAICLMVYGHVETIGMGFIYLFHMPLFFILSGYLTRMNAPDVTPLGYAVGGGEKEDKRAL